ncbi:hypothetical protein IV203_025829 [Nitzschia inconspicua]|uniref:Uncharacterized protein n=1 Tax=Nitzschia inconspicua TaxID=303405 RepID=A0A9K3LIC9_9STRA|nr:hypothetical protein IV203_017677 [Nitzschia inconspicua]KAG7362163.1 hypothetical protein IV203_025829 [Nitzschia inconspicua]
MLQIRSAFLALAILASSALSVEDERESVYSIVRKGRSVEQEEVARVLAPKLPKSTKAPTFPPTPAPTRAPSPPTPAPTRAPTVPTPAPTKSVKSSKSTKAPTTPPTKAPTNAPTNPPTNPPTSTTR